MKKFSKLFLSCAAAAALTAAVATSAMAADNTLTATYEAGAETGTVTINCASTDAIKTLLILDAGVNKDKMDPNKDIIQIDQAAEIETAVVPLLEKDGTYTVLMGGTSGVIYEGTFKIGEGSAQLLGDVDNSSVINSNDASGVMKHFVGSSVLIGDNLQAADADDSGIVNSNDASEIMKYFVGATSKVDGIKTVSDKTNIVE